MTKREKLSFLIQAGARQYATDSGWWLAGEFIGASTDDAFENIKPPAPTASRRVGQPLTALQTERVARALAVELERNGGLCRR
jgi:hypothetical protein